MDGTLLGAVLVSLIVGVIPIFVSLHFARRSCLADQSKKLLAMAADVASRADQTGEQIRRVSAELSSGEHGAPGSEAEIQHMRGLAMTSTYLQAVGRLDGTKVTCTSMGVLDPPVELGAPDVTTVAGVNVWLDVQLDFAGAAPFHALGYGPFVVFITRDLVLDVYSDEINLSVAVVTGTAKKVLSQEGEVLPDALNELGERKSASFVYGDRVVALCRSDGVDIVGYVSQPLSDAYADAGQSALLFLPVGGVVGLVISLFSFRVARRQLTLPYIMRSAIKNQEFFMLYQPVVDLATERIVGAEALIRWRRATGEMIRPDHFIPAAEECGIITKITEYVIDESFRACSQLNAKFPGTYIGINVTSSDVRSGTLSDQLRSAAERHAVDLKNIGVEITETGLLDVNNIIPELDKLNALGLRLAMDDFGTGYSNLSYLMKLDIDALKIDKLFVDAIGTDSATSGVVDHMIEMAMKLDKYIIAEGIESQHQAEYLRDRSVQAGQGYYFGRPMTLDDLTARLSKQREASA